MMQLQANTMQLQANTMERGPLQHERELRIPFSEATLAPRVMPSANIHRLPEKGTISRSPNRQDNYR